MNTGKIPENVLKRSILKVIKKRRGEVLVGATVGGDCAVFRMGDLALSSVSTAEFGTDSGLRHAFVSSSNNIAAKGGETVGFLMSAVFPADTEEPLIKETALKAEKLAAELGAQTVGGSTEISDAVNRPVISVTAVGRAEETAFETLKNGAAPGDSVVLIGHIALEGTAAIIKAKEAELLKKFPADMIYRAENFEKLMSVKKEAALAIKSGVTAMHDLSRGGVFAALWELAEHSGVGLETDLRKIPVMQESIEICNFFDINPYELTSAGGLLVTAKDAKKLISDLKKEGVEAVVIGVCTDSNDRVLINGESRRFLEIPKTDEIYKIFG